MKPEKFNVGVKFKYMGNGNPSIDPFADHIGITQEVTSVEYPFVSSTLQNDRRFHVISEYASYCKIANK